MPEKINPHAEHISRRPVNLENFVLYSEQKDEESSLAMAERELLVPQAVRAGWVKGRSPSKRVTVRPACEAHHTAALAEPHCSQ